MQGYFKVELIRRLPEGGSTAQICWVPSEFAQLGKYLRIEGTDGWLVSNVYMQMPKSFVHEDRIFSGNISLGTER